LILVGVSGFQIAIVLGAPWGKLTQGGSHPGTLPTTGRAIAGVSAALLITMASAELASVGGGPLSRAPTKMVGGALWFTTIYASLGVALNLASPSLPEKLLWTPVTATISGLSIATLRAWRRRPRT
jgi:hypothetical protein